MIFKFILYNFVEFWDFFSISNENIWWKIYINHMFRYHMYHRYYY